MLPNRNALAPRNDPQEDDAQEDAVDTRSKTRRKRDAEALQAALSLSHERRAELARTAQEHVRSTYGLAQSNQQLLALYHRRAAR